MHCSDEITLVSLNSRYIQSNTAVYYLYELLSSEGFECRVMNHTINEDIHHVLGSIMESKPKVICFSGYIWNIGMVYKLCSLIRKINKDIFIVLGGPEVSYVPGEALEKSRADLIIRGEAETIAGPAVQGLLKGEMPDIPGLYYRDGKVIVDTGYAITENLDEVPNAFTDFMMSTEKDKLIYYESSRGCPFNCIYCLSSATKGVRYMSLERVFSDIKAIINHKPRVVKFTDRSFNSNQDRAVELLDFIDGLETGTCFHLEIYPGTIGKALMDRLISMKPGRIQVEAGIQSVDDNVLLNSGRPQDPEKALDNLVKLVDSGKMHVHADLIAGLPGDSKSSFKDSFNRTVLAFPHKMQVGFLKLLKGTAARELRGYEYEDEAPYEVISSDSMVYSELQEIREVADVFDRTYNSGLFTEYFKYILSECSDPYEFFRELTLLMKQKGIRGRGISANDRYELLASLNEDDEALNRLGYDFLCSSKSKIMPSSLGGKILSKSHTFDLLKKEAEKSPDMEARKLYKHCTIAEFVIGGSKTTYLFDYSKKDPSTGLFLTKIL